LAQRRQVVYLQPDQVGPALDEPTTDDAEVERSRSLS